MHVDQDEHDPLVLGKASQRRAHVETDLGLTMSVVGVDHVDVGSVASATQDIALAAKAIEAGVDDDAVQPRGHSRITAIGAGAAERVDEAVLDAVGSELTITRGAHGDSPESIAVPAEELTEGVGVTRDMSGHEGAIVGALEVGHVSS